MTNTNQTPEANRPDPADGSAGNSFERFIEAVIATHPGRGMDTGADDEEGEALLRDELTAAFSSAEHLFRRLDALLQLPQDQRSAGEAALLLQEFGAFRSTNLSPEHAAAWVEKAREVLETTIVSSLQTISGETQDQVQRLLQEGRVLRPDELREGMTLKVRAGGLTQELQDRGVEEGEKFTVDSVYIDSVHPEQSTMSLNEEFGDTRTLPLRFLKHFYCTTPVGPSAPPPQPVDDPARFAPLAVDDSLQLDLPDSSPYQLQPAPATRPLSVPSSQAAAPLQDEEETANAANPTEYYLQSIKTNNKLFSWLAENEELPDTQSISISVLAGTLRSACKVLTNENVTRVELQSASNNCRRMEEYLTAWLGNHQSNKRANKVRTLLGLVRTLRADINSCEATDAEDDEDSSPAVPPVPAPQPATQAVPATPPTAASAGPVAPPPAPPASPPPPAPSSTPAPAQAPSRNEYVREMDVLQATADEFIRHASDAERSNVRLAFRTLRIACSNNAHIPERSIPNFQASVEYLHDFLTRWTASEELTELVEEWRARDVQRFAENLLHDVLMNANHIQAPTAQVPSQPEETELAAEDTLRNRYNAVRVPIRRIINAERQPGMRADVERMFDNVRHAIRHNGKIEASNMQAFRFDIQELQEYLRNISTGTNVVVGVSQEQVADIQALVEDVLHEVEDKVDAFEARAQVAAVEQIPGGVALNLLDEDQQREAQNLAPIRQRLSIPPENAHAADQWNEGRPYHSRREYVNNIASKAGAWAPVAFAGTFTYANGLKWAGALPVIGMFVGGVVGVAEQTYANGWKGIGTKKSWSRIWSWVKTGGMVGVGLNVFANPLRTAATTAGGAAVGAILKARENRNRRNHLAHHYHHGQDLFHVFLHELRIDSGQRPRNLNSNQLLDAYYALDYFKNNLPNGEKDKAKGPTRIPSQDHEVRQYTIGIEGEIMRRILARDAKLQEAVCTVQGNPRDPTQLSAMIGRIYQTLHSKKAAHIEANKARYDDRAQRAYASALHHLDLHVHHDHDEHHEPAAAAAPATGHETAHANGHGAHGHGGGGMWSDFWKWLKETPGEKHEADKH